MIPESNCPRKPLDGAGSPASDCSAFGPTTAESAHTEIEPHEATPTMHLRWCDGTLQQMWDVTERRCHYMGGRYNSSTYHHRNEWRDVENIKTNDKMQAIRTGAPADHE